MNFRETKRINETFSSLKAHKLFKKKLSPICGGIENSAGF